MDDRRATAAGPCQSPIISHKLAHELLGSPCNYHGWQLALAGALWMPWELVMEELKGPCNRVRILYLCITWGLVNMDGRGIIIMGGMSPM